MNKKPIDALNLPREFLPPNYDDGSIANIPATIAAFSAAWAIGFIALPLPSGLFVRESVLLVLLDIDLPDLVAVSLAHRTAVLAAEFSLMVLFAARGAVIRGRRP